MGVDGEKGLQLHWWVFVPGRQLVNTLIPLSDQLSVVRFFDECGNMRISRIDLNGLRPSAIASPWLERQFRSLLTGSHLLIAARHWLQTRVRTATRCIQVDSGIRIITGRAQNGCVLLVGKQESREKVVAQWPRPHESASTQLRCAVVTTSHSLER